MKSQTQSWTGLLVTIFLPAVILLKLSGPDRLGPVYGLIAALALPLGWGVFEWIQERRVGFIAALGFIGILLTGGIGLLELPARWIAYKEAGVPFIIASAVLITVDTKHSLVERFLGQVLDIGKVQRVIAERNMTALFQQRLRRAGYGIAGSFFFSAVLNFTLARVLITGEAGTQTFNEQLGRMTALSYPVIAIPSMIIFTSSVLYLLQGMVKETGMEVQDFLRS